jgi:hypothetical protein
MALTGTIFDDDAVNDALYTNPPVTGGSLLIEVGEGGVKAGAFSIGGTSLLVAVTPSTISFTNVVPASGSQLTGTTEPVSFTIVNGALMPFSLWVKFTSESRRFLVYDSFLGFSYPFDSSTRVGDDFVVAQRGGWQGDIEAFNIGGVA